MNTLTKPTLRKLAKNGITRVRLIETLSKVKQLALAGEYEAVWTNGICWCWHVELDSEVSYCLVDALSVGWKHRTNEKEYPVPETDEGALWRGKGLEYRLDLIDYMLAKLEGMEDICLASLLLGNSQES